MQISLPISPSKIPSIFPFNYPISHKTTVTQHPHQTHLKKSYNSASLNSFSGYSSSIGSIIQDKEEYRKARAAVTRKGVDLEGYSIEGLSIGGQETCLIIPEFKCAFDIGRCPARAIHQNFFLFITHGHLDHIGGLPMYVASRGLYNVKPPTVFVPPCIKEDVEKLFDIHRAMGQVELNLELVALDVGVSSIILLC